MAASAVRGAVALRTSVSRPVAFVRKIPWTAASSELREHFAQFGHVRKCTVPFDKETGFHRGMGWIQFSSEEELQNALQQENHILDGVKVNIFLYNIMSFLCISLVGQKYGMTRTLGDL
ncbi:SRA stem-loop-interacting RNA-binding protein, mitochondrial isoform X1 [Callorhinus ursinus]|uniref:SRA stem-loop-interacting RNA-binding protein, mitochondrial n=1 Tax=Zalophus californianus TaxID=9704 RepID=A0A6J2B7W1_ZALCA|nr:SRA stem-loop-interacting RNA-binding protein, mitochondrial isoform X1 [Zalophus californianus]XP_027953673.1 SRA stem-loop-interacting RNA-binding protein, mitochondrial isoform X1 [Eumetopias jubatus]